MFITYLMYTIVTNIKDKKGCRKKMHLKNASNVSITVLNLLLVKLCCFVVKLNKLKVKCQLKDNCKLLYFNYLHYFTLHNCSVIFFLNLFHNNELQKFNAYIYKTSKLQM